MDNNVIDESKFVEMDLPIKCKSIIKEEECLSRVDCLFNKSNKCQQKPLTTKRKDIKNKEEEQPQIIKSDDVIEIIPVKKNKIQRKHYIP